MVCTTSLNSFLDGSEGKQIRFPCRPSARSRYDQDSPCLRLHSFERVWKGSPATYITGHVCTHRRVCPPSLHLIVSLTSLICRLPSAFDNYFLQAQRVRKLVRTDFDRVFAIPNPLSARQTQLDPKGVLLLLHPSAIRTAPLLEEKARGGRSSLDAYVQDVLTVPASLAGLPALSVPAGLAEDGWPVGVSVVSQWGCDEMVLEVGRVIEQCIS